MINRKAFLLNAIEEGFKNDVSGYPLSLKHSKGKNLKDYKIYGNSVQNGTPTPDNPIEIESVGDLVTDESDANYGKYKIPVKVSGTNIFDGLLQEGDYGAGANRISSVNYIPVKPNTTYIFSRNNERVYMYDEAKTQLSRVDTGNNGNTITTTEDTRYIRVVWFGTEDTTQTIWINEGTELLDYEPYYEPIITNIYLDEPLRKIGDYADYIDFKNGKVVRKIGSGIILKSSTYIPSKKKDVCWFSVYGLDVLLPHIIDTPVISKMFKSLQNAWWQNDEGVLSHKINTNGVYFSLKWERIGLVYDGTNVYKKEDTEKTKPLTDLEIYNLIGEYFPNTFTKDERTIHYALLTPTEETIELPNIPTHKGTNIIKVDTIVEASNLNVSYKSFEKE